MRAKKLEDLQVYRKALEGIAAVSPILERLKVRKDRLGIARGSAQETRGHLATALQRQHISEDDEKRVSSLYGDLCNMLTAFIEYLRRSDFRDRW
jgi:four helix bundle protein